MGGQYDKRFYDTVWGESGGGSVDEIRATAAVYDNLAKQLGYEKALKKSNAYRKESPQYKLAKESKFNMFEKTKYELNKVIIDSYLQDPNLPYTAMENVNAFGEPPWSKDYDKSKDAGRQRFYWKDKKKEKK